MKLFVVVLRRPGTGLRLKGHRLVHQQARCGQLTGLTITGRFQRRKIDEGFEERARLPPRLNGAIEFAPPLIPPSDQPQHRTSLRIEHHHRPLHRIQSTVEMGMRSL